MDQEVYINNFRLFQDFNLGLSRINILIGENSSGKSSFLKLLLALKQTIEDPDISSLILNGAMVDLGNYKEAVYFHEEDTPITFGFSFDKSLFNFFMMFFGYEIRNKNPEFESLLKKATQNKTSIKFTLDKELTNHKKIKTQFHNKNLGEMALIVETAKEEVSLSEGTRCSIIYNRKIDSTLYEFKNLRYDAKAFLSLVYSQELINMVKEKEISTIIFYEIAIFLLSQNLTEEFLRNIKYINPLSTRPERFYFKKDLQSKYKENNLEKFANQISNNTISSKEMKEFQSILAEFGIVDNIKLNSSKEFPVVEIKVELKDLVSNIYDVGYGVGLQVPLIFEAFMSEKNHGNHFLIEQPEVHLHPRLQAKLIEILIGLGTKNSYIIETHSEHIVRMLQVIVKEGKYNIKPNDISIYYFSRGEKAFEISRYKILENGHLDKTFPSGFYDNSYNLTKSLIS